MGQPLIAIKTDAATICDRLLEDYLKISLSGKEGVGEAFLTTIPHDTFQLIVKAADNGVASAQVLLGSCCEEGFHVSKDLSKAIKWYRQAADQGNAFGQLSLGACYGEGLGVPQDERKMVELYQRAAEQGNALAQAYLGGLYRDGNGVPQNYTKAAELFQQAAEQGNKNAIEALETLKR